MAYEFDFDFLYSWLDYELPVSPMFGHPDDESSHEFWVPISNEPGHPP